MKCSDYIKSKGLKSLLALSKETGQSPQTIRNWYLFKRDLFDVIVEGALKRNSDNSIKGEIK